MQFAFSIHLHIYFSPLQHLNLPNIYLHSGREDGREVEEVPFFIIVHGVDVLITIFLVIPTNAQ